MTLLHKRNGPVAPLLARSLQNVNNQFTQTCMDPRVGYLGNVSVGVDVTLAELRRLYHTVRAVSAALQ